MRYTAIAAAAALAGCASQPQPVADNSPQNPTAVFETKLSSSGIAGNFPFETTEKRYVRADMRRDEHSGKGTGTFSGFLMTKLMGQGDTTIARLDSNKLWTVDHSHKQYTECPVHGCPPPPAQEEKREKGEPQAEEPKSAEQPKQKTEEGCTTRIVSSKLDVKPTGEKQTLNGFAAEQYKMAWVVRMQDRKKRTTTSTVNVDLWTAPLNAQMRTAMETEAAYNKAFLASAPRSAHKEKDEAAVMPQDMIRSMTSYVGGLSARDRASLARAANELNKVKGHPIRTTVEWFLEGNACAPKEEAQPAPAAQPTNPSDMVVSGVMSMFSKKEEKAGPKPVVSFTMEVKQLGVLPVHDSVFSVPSGYKLVKQ